MKNIFMAFAIAFMALPTFASNLVVGPITSSLEALKDADYQKMDFRLTTTLERGLSKQLEGNLVAVFLRLNGRYTKEQIQADFGIKVGTASADARATIVTARITLQEALELSADRRVISVQQAGPLFPNPAVRVGN